MKTITLIAATAIALLNTSANATTYSPLRVSVIAFYAMNNSVQRAVVADVCKNFDDQGHSDMIDIKAAGSKLPKTDRRRYDVVRMLLDQAYEKSEGTDSALEQVQNDFC